MNPVGVLLSRNIEMFIIMTLGFLLVKKEVFTTSATDALGFLLTRIVMPLVLFSSLWVEKTPEKTDALLTSTFLSGCLCLLSLAAARLLFPSDGVSRFSAAFPNAGFLGIPLVQSVLGSEALIWVSPLILWVGLLQYTAGLSMIAGSQKAHPMDFLRSPVAIAIITGALFYTFGVPRPPLASSLLSDLGAMNTPLAMLLLGSYLASCQLKKIFLSPSYYFLSFCRLLLIPCLSALLLFFLPLGMRDHSLALLIPLSCPAGSLGAIFAKEYHGDWEKAAQQVSLSTLLSLVTLPLCLFLFSIF